jgi:hypothetical protein
MIKKRKLDFQEGYTEVIGEKNLEGNEVEFCEEKETVISSMVIEKVGQTRTVVDREFDNIDEFGDNVELIDSASETAIVKELDDLEVRSVQNVTVEVDSTYVADEEVRMVGSEEKRVDDKELSDISVFDEIVTEKESVGEGDVDQVKECQTGMKSTDEIISAVRGNEENSDHFL